MIFAANPSRFAMGMTMAMSVLSIIPLAILFAACSSKSAPQSLYFMKVDLTSFPDLKNLKLRRSASITDGIPSDAVSSAAGAVQGAADSASQTVSAVSSTVSNAASNAASQASDAVSSALGQFKPQYPDYYAVGLRGYCQENKGAPSFSNCSEPSIDFAFDLLHIFGPLSDEIEALLPTQEKSISRKYHAAFRWAIVGYVIGTVSAVLTVILVGTSALFGRKLGLRRSYINASVLVATTLALVFNLGSSCTVTIVYSVMCSLVRHTLYKVGVDASLGSLLVPAWFCVGLSLGSVVFAALLMKHPYADQYSDTKPILTYDGC
ncbi:hypothetical protein N7470_000619 [Penicillium chermesinum]|nr:hypothetical protein N7470_000619 [Penicillium chermesinum]